MSKTHIDLNGRTILVTGSPGFIGANLVMRLRRELTSGTVISFDNMNDYYDPDLKEYRLRIINAISSPVRHVFVKGSIADKALVDEIFRTYKPSIVVNLAAQAGVRYSIDHPDVYIESNLIGFYNILEACRHSYDDGSTKQITNFGVSTDNRTEAYGYYVVTVTAGSGVTTTVKVDKK